MPLALNFSSGGKVSFTPKALRGTWAWELELEVPNTTNQRVINFNDNNFRYLRANSGFWDLRNNLSGLPDTTSTTPVTTNTRTVIRLEAAADEVSWFIDGTPQGVIGTQTNDFILNNLNNTGNFSGKIYRFDVWENGVLVESRNKQTLTSGNDRVYTDNVGTNDGALDATFPNDNSQWEFYSDGGGGTEQDITANDSQQAQQAETQTLSQTQQASGTESQQLSETDPQIVSVTHVVAPSQPEQLNQAENKTVTFTQPTLSLEAEQISESTQPVIQLTQQTQHNEAQQNTNADSKSVVLSQVLQAIEVEQKANADQLVVQDGGGITANDAQQQSESKQQSITANQSVNSFEANQKAESVQATVTLAQQINAVEVEHFAQADQSVITDGNGIVAAQVEQKYQAQVSEVTQTQQVSPFNVEQKPEAEQALPAIIQRLLAVDAEQTAQTPTLQVSDSDIIIDPQKISVERVTPTFTIQLVERPKYSIVRL